MTIARLIAGRGGEVWRCHAEDTVADAVEVLAKKRIGALPVQDGDGDGVAGIFSERDVLYSLQNHGADALRMKVRDVMTAPVITIAPDTSVMEALALMTRRRFRHLPVVDAGKLVGIISIGDVVKSRVAEMEHEQSALKDYIMNS